MAAEPLRDAPWGVPDITDPMFGEDGDTKDWIFFIA